jgi:glycine/D-amino acid oxidase-like deaminating enzyme
MNTDYERRPYWHATMPVLPDRRAAAPPAKADVVVIGGGYTGVAAARRLADRGATVALLEAERLGFGASTRNGGIIHPGYKYGPRALIARYGDELGRALWTETLAAYRHVAGIIRDEGIDCEFRECGYLELAYGPSHLAGLARASDELTAAGLPARTIARADLRSEIGSDAYHGGMLVAESGLLHPGKWFAALTGLASRAGAQLHEGIRARRITHDRGTYRVVTDRGTIDAGDVVVATNGYTDGVAPSLRRRILPIGSYIIATEPLPTEVAHELSPNGRAFFDTKNFLYYWHITADRRVVFGGRASMWPTTVDRSAAILHRGLLEVHPQLAPYRIEFAWGGKVAYTFDRMPHAGRMGRSAGGRGIAYAMGYCGTGVAMSTYLGTRIADWLCGDDPPALARLSFPLVPAPYEGRPWFLPLVGEWYRLKDRLAARGR